MENLDIRILVSKSGLHYKEIAFEMGITDKYLSRLMGKPLSEKMRYRILKAIDVLKGEKDE